MSEKSLISSEIDYRAIRHGQDIAPNVNVTGGEIFVVDDDPMIRDLLQEVFEFEGYQVRSFVDGEQFATLARASVPACIVLDICLPGRSGLDILKDIDAHNYPAPIIIMSGMATIAIAVEAVKDGAFDIIEKPIDMQTIVTRVRNVIGAWSRRHKDTQKPELPLKLAGCPALTMRETEVLVEIMAAASNKEVAGRLGISPRTVEVHRARIMLKLGAKNTADLVRIVLTKQQLTTA